MHNNYQNWVARPVARTVEKSTEEVVMQRDHSTPLCWHGLIGHGLAGKGRRQCQQQSEFCPMSDFGPGLDGG